MTWHRKAWLLLLGFTFLVFGGACLVPVVFAHLSVTSQLMKTVSVGLVIVAVPLMLLGVGLLLVGIVRRAAPLAGAPRRWSAAACLSAFLGVPFVALQFYGLPAMISIVLAVVALRETLLRGEARGAVLACLGYTFSVACIINLGVLRFVGPN